MLNGPVLPARFEGKSFADVCRVGSDGGTELGLMVAQHIAEANGGTIALESGSEKGVIFRISLPNQPSE